MQFLRIVWGAGEDGSAFLCLPLPLALKRVIYDPFQCPRLIVSEAHSVFPVESVYGAVSVKSHLDSTELADAHANIVSFKKILDRSNFQSFPHSGIVMGMSAPMPVTGIFAFAANRSLEAIKDQLNKLNNALNDQSLKPDFVAVLEMGFIAHQQPLRGSFNAFNAQADDFGTFRKTGRQACFQAMDVEIDGKIYAVDFSQLAEDDFDEDADMTVDELLAP